MIAVPNVRPVAMFLKILMLLTFRVLSSLSMCSDNFISLVSSGNPEINKLDAGLA